MKNPSDNWDELRQKVLGLGDSSLRKTHYPSLRQRLAELERLRSELQQSEAELRQLIDAIPQHVFILEPDGSTLYVNQVRLDYSGLTLEEAVAKDAPAKIYHPDDVERVLAERRNAVSRGAPSEVEARILGADGKYRWFLIRINPLRDEQGRILRWYGTGTDIEDRKQAEFYLAEGQRLAHMGSWVFGPTGFDYWSPELFRTYGLGPATNAPTVQEYLDCIHPQDREFMANLIKRILADASCFDVTKRIVRPDGEVRYVRCVGAPVGENQRLRKFIGTAMDVTEHELLAQELRRREAYLAEAQRLSHTGSFGWKPSTGEHLWSEETYRIFQYEPTTKPTVELILERVHPEDRADARETIKRAPRELKDFEHEYRLLMPDGSIKYLHIVTHAVSDESGSLEFIGAVMDVTAARQAEEKIREQEMEARQMLDLAPQQVAVFGPGGERLYANRIGLDYVGLSLEEWRQTPGNIFASGVIHPDDRERAARAYSDSTRPSGSAYELELRVRGADGNYRWFLYRFNPLHDDKGQLMRWYVVSTDIDERKRAEEKLQQENVALREDIDKASMFEEIVGTSPALQKVLSRVSKVAPTGSTVLITGATGTGKELIARAIHKRSQRSARAFVSANCAAIPRDLIASELFGHEKGAFTGATQRRLGRFELAEGGTIFLDEIGELPAETQVALLRVLQEHEFERVGGTGSIRSNVRVIAATNRDLYAAIAAGAFRLDLFYRLNVFPIELPSLEERKEDIPVLVEYFIDRFARKAGKTIRRVDKKSLDLLQSYPWPGNIRELQNVIERSVILCDSENFSVDASWLSQQPLETELNSPLDLTQKLAAQEKEMIEAALRASGGRVFGPAGAAVKLGMARSTLESKIRSLKINKNRFKTANPL